MKKKTNENLKSYDDKLKYFCHQNETYSKMLYEMIQKNTNEGSNKIKSNSELFKLVSRFNKAL